MSESSGQLTMEKVSIRDLLHKARTRMQRSQAVNLSTDQDFCVNISRLLTVSKEVKCFAFEHLQEIASFYQESGKEGPTICKKRRLSKDHKVSLRRNMEAVYRLVQCFGQHLSEVWNQSDLLDHLLCDDLEIRWCVVHSVGSLLGMSAKRLKDWCLQLFTVEQNLAMCLRYDNAFERCLNFALLLSNPDHSVDSDKELNATEISAEVTSVCGVLLPTLPGASNLNASSRLTMVPSTHRNLERLALAVAVGAPVLLEGPVGCGKTSLVEHLAAFVGRTKTPELMKLQLGDQTDSKALIGTYRCTDIPGEFIWQSGCLVQAVQCGHWLLLEDLDYAPMDVISVLIPLLETGSLCLPGYGNKITAAPGFRIFATQRLMSSTSGWHLQQSSNSVVLERLWRRLRVEPLSANELEQVIVDRYPSLKDVVKRLLNVYFMLSTCKLENNVTEDCIDEDVDIGKFIIQNGRPVSTRDLMKWCERITASLDGSRSISAETILLDALDCFSACLPVDNGRLPVSRAIAAKIGFAESKAEYYCLAHSPEVKISDKALQIGRIKLDIPQVQTTLIDRCSGSFAFTRPATALLEQIAVCVKANEPVLLVGETGTGKTSIVQYMADKMHQTLHVINLNQQSDMADLLGGFKPVDLHLLIIPFVEEFEILFCESFSRVQNQTFLGHIQQMTREKSWKKLFQLMNRLYLQALQSFAEGNHLRDRWQQIKQKLVQLETLFRRTESCLAFSFIEGVLVRALRNGSWVLLDEINLATAETLECLSGLLESTTGSVVLTERGDTEPVKRHPNFRLFACMNPAADVGKKDLPLGIRNRFTEMFVDELVEDHDLGILVLSYLRAATPETVHGIVAFYQAVREIATEKLIDGTGHHPHFSLRTLCRALRQAAQRLFGNARRSIYEAFRLSFLTQLDRASYPLVEKLIRQHVLGGQGQAEQPIPAPPGDAHVNVEGYWIAKGANALAEQPDYIITASVRENLKDIARIVSAGKLPVLLQGETSVGKTSVITYLAKRTGNTCYRINNHEHTDIQEYIGCYAVDHGGKLVFREGILVEAMRKGYWIILDELNLAPSDVLEAVNRLLDDNRELFIPEMQEVVKAHPRFILFATQNPPGLYGGRKVLSRAFRNRFVELHFDTIKSSELIEILNKRCWLSVRHCKLLVEIMLDLQTKRRNSGLFAGKQSFITLRDLFRWAERHRLEQEGKDWDQILADNGYMLLAGRMRQPEDEQLVKEAIEKHFRRKIDHDRLFSLSDETSLTTLRILEKIVSRPPDGFEHVVWTMAMRRMAVLVAQALKFGEPVLLVGETGCGKTTMCQVYAQLEGRSLRSVNCHMHSESSDFLGGLRPVRHKSQDAEQSQKLFEWCDGPLVSAMREGGIFLLDEISLADDSVLERLNSVLETERTLLLVEKGCDPHDKVDKIVAEPEFRIVATMNPGGDYGKKELSPALRNRFTEIWCPLTRSKEDLVRIVEHNLNGSISLTKPDGTSGCGLGLAMVEFTEWLRGQDFAQGCLVTIRDLLSWVIFINKTARVSTDANSVDQDEESVHLDPAVAYIHGAFLVFIDCLRSGISSIANLSCLQFLVNQMKNLTGKTLDVSDLGIIDPKSNSQDQSYQSSYTDKFFGLHPFYIARGPLLESGITNYAFEAPTTAQNALRVMRALQLPRPILLEGSPGVGKTSLVAALAKAAGHHLVRINLSEQTDVTDLFGSDLPIEGGKAGQFSWRDGPLLSALKGGHWVVLDELNLASQSVLEGLNACFDHRSEVFIPELGMTFHVQHEKTKLFACQNPLSEGGGRKGLPKSFLNRFTQVYVDPLLKADLLFIVKTMFPQLELHLLTQMVDFNQAIHDETVGAHLWGQKGGPWEFNLRDLFRWCELVVKNQVVGKFEPDEFVHLLYVSRMRTREDRLKVLETFEKVFGRPVKEYFTSRQFSVTHMHVQVGNSFLRRQLLSSDVERWTERTSLRLLHHSLQPLSALMKCVDMNWMAILIGGSCTGKTSLVQLLARLTGSPLKILSMNSAIDTTELLGGFEQMNLLRQIEGLEASIRNLCQEMISVVLSLGDTSHLQEIKLILDLLHKETEGPHNGCHLSEVENDCNKANSHLRRFDRILTTLQTFVAKNNLSQYTEKILQLQSSVSGIHRRLETDKTLNHGGRFEWIDSTLVQCLKEGSWLLIDNVNFCSASVLDRLNALVEPNGVLVVNERGVVDGTVPTIVPHSDFRLFLSMDPKHGEISRAMRNRGIEICILGEGDGEGYDRFDVKAMLHAIGIVGRIPTDVIISVHENLKRQFGREEHFGITHLLQTATLASQMMERGSDFQSALRSTMSDVYGQMAHDQKRKQKILDLIDFQLTVHLQSLKMPEVNSLGFIEAGLWPWPLPSGSELSDEPSLAVVRFSSALFLHLINVFAEKDAEKNDLVSIDVPWSRSLTQLRERIRSLLFVGARIMFENSPVESIPLLLRYINRQMEKSSTAFHISGVDTVKKDLIKKILGAFDVVLKSPVLAVLEAKAKELLQPFDIDGNWLPVDWRWNEAMHRIIEISCIRSGHDVNKKLNDVKELGNQIFLVFAIAQAYAALMHFLADESSEETMSSSSAFQMSLAHQNGDLDTEELPHAALQHIAPFVNSFFPAVLKRLETPVPLTDDQLLLILKGLPWLMRFLEICCCPLDLRLSPELSLLEVALHWNWLHVHLIRPLLENGFCFYDHLKYHADQLQNHFGSNDNAYKVRETIRSHRGHIKPFRVEAEAVNNLKIEAISDCLDVCSKHSLTPEAECYIMKVASDSGFLNFKTEVVYALSKVCWEASSELADVLNSSVGKLEEYFASVGFRWSAAAQHGSNLMPLDNSVHDVVSFEAAVFNLWPVFGLLFSTEESHLLAQYFSSANYSNSVDFGTLVTFACARTVVPATSLVPLKMANVVSMKEVSDGLISNFFGHLKQNVTCVNRCLMWNPETAGQLCAQKVFNSVFSPSLSYCIFSLLAGNTSSQSHDLAANCRLGGGHERLNQLKALNVALWTNSSCIGSGCWNRHNILALLCGVLENLLNSLPFGACYPEPVSKQNLFHLLEDRELSAQSPLSLLLPNWNEYLSNSMQLAAEIKECGDAFDYWKFVMKIGEAWTSVGILQCHLEVPQGPADPNQRMAFELQHKRNELRDVQEEMDMRSWNCSILYGSDLKSSHPLAMHLFGQQQILETWIRENANKIAYRPTLSQYPSLLRETRRQLRMITSNVPLIGRLRSVFDGVDRQNQAANTVEEARIFSAMCDEFIEHLQKSYPLYRDVLSGFISALHQLQFGVDSMAQAVWAKSLSITLSSSHQPVQNSLSVEELIGLLVRFPFICEQCSSVVHLVTQLMSTRVTEMLFRLEDIISENAEVAHSLLPRILQISLLHLNNAVLSSGSLSRAAVQMFEVIFDQYVSSWRRAEEMKRQREEEESSIYRYKNIGETHTEEERDEMEIVDRFPCFEEDFRNIGDEDILSKASSLETSAEKGHLTEKSGVTDEEMSVVSAIHQSVFIHLTSSPWHQMTSDGTLKNGVDSLKPLLQSYEIAAEISKSVASQLSPELEPHLIGGHLMLAAFSSGNILPPEFNRQNTPDETDVKLKVPLRPYDIYYDSNVHEVLLCLPVLERFLRRIHELLESWPDHPTLKMLVTIISRINGFPVKSSVMRFVLGLEMLLEHSKDWEAVAASRVSIASHTEEITQLVIRWRSLELSCWKSCLDSVSFKAHQRSSHWWFHVYKLVEPYLKPGSTTLPENDLPQLLKALHEFLESSQVGEYVGRLRILLAFHCHLMHSESSSPQLGDIRSIFWNVYQFYEQFLPNVEAFTAKSRTPIEKELKDFVKIARWNDKNFYAVKAAVHKSHKTLHKHMKQFESVLATSVRSILMENESKLEASAGQRGSAESSCKADFDKFLIKMVELPEDIASKVPHLSRRMSRYCHDVMSKMSYDGLIRLLDEFTGSVIEGVSELQLLSVDHIKDKEKQKSEVKHICQRKKKALVDLFKQLKVMGLSYQKGLVEMNSTEHNSYLLKWFTQEPCNVALSLAQLLTESCDGVTASAWNGCDKYFVRCLNRRTLFHTAVQTPSKELDMTVLDRSKGFSEHLSVEVEKQRRHLVDYVNKFLAVRKCIQKLSSLNSSGQTTLPSQNMAKLWQMDLKSITERVADFVRQFRLLLHCAPNSEQQYEQISPIKYEHLPPMATAQKDDDIWCRSIAKLEDSESLLNRILIELNKAQKSDVFITLADVNDIRSGFDTLRNVSEILSNIEQSFMHASSFQSSGIAASISYVTSEISDIFDRFEKYFCTLQNDAIVNLACEKCNGDEISDKFSEKVDCLMRKCLKVVEEFVKKLEDVGKQTMDESSLNVEDRDCVSENGDDEFEGILTNKLGKMLSDDMDSMKLEKINQSLDDLISSVSNWSNDPQLFGTVQSALCSLLSRLPIFKQYICLAQFIMTQRIAGFRATAKLLTVLFDIFQGLAQKGFCLPQGLLDELMQEGATEFQDIEGGGVGEGEGVQDVSEKIESEDQVEGLKENEKNVDKGNQPDIRSEDNAIEMSDDLDGKIHDLEKSNEEDEEEDDKDDKDVEDELDKEMGDVGEEEVDKLDEKMWGSDEEEEEEEKSEQNNKKEEFGEGDGQQSKAELAAKDDRCQEAQDDRNKNSEKDDQLDEPPEFDEETLDENVHMPPTEVQAPEDEEGPMELPDDLNIDGNEDENEEAARQEEAETKDPTDGEQPMEDPEKVPTNKDGEGQELREESACEKDEPQPETEEEIIEEGQEKQREDEEQDDKRNTEPMDVNTEQEDTVHQPGYQAKEENDDEKPEENPTQEENVEVKKSDHGTKDVQQMEGIKDTAGTADDAEKEENAGGAAMSDSVQGNEGGKSYAVAQGSADKQKKKRQKRRPGQSSDDRSMGNTAEKTENRLKTVDSTTEQEQNNRREPQLGDAYEYINDSTSQFDAQTLDAATEDQLQQQIDKDALKKSEDVNEDAKMEEDDEEFLRDSTVRPLSSTKLSGTKMEEPDEIDSGKSKDAENKTIISGERVETATVLRSSKSSIHTVLENYNFTPTRELDVEKLRKILEERMINLDLVSEFDVEWEEARLLWQQYENLTSHLSHELCEQVRLILEPTQASKLKGDYRTGKRISMRKVIPYIASQFRKDKIWLRRTKPSKRQYQVMIAIDDSSSMEYNDSKQLAYESLALISNALTKLEVGELSICSFGESVRILHSFQESFTPHSGAKILQQLRYKQNATNMVHLLQFVAGTMLDARRRLSGSFQHSNTAQLLLIVSDGKMRDGLKSVEAAIQMLREANIFVVFVVLDNPDNKDSILDTSYVTTDENNKIRIQKFAEVFPFPFYIILRNVHTLPQTLSDALRQWFELVTAADL